MATPGCELGRDASLEAKGFTVGKWVANAAKDATCLIVRINKASIVLRDHASVDVAYSTEGLLQGKFSLHNDAEEQDPNFVTV